MNSASAVLQPALKDFEKLFFLIANSVSLLLVIDEKNLEKHGKSEIPLIWVHFWTRLINRIYHRYTPVFV